jgi:hypothetical protein
MNDTQEFLTCIIPKYALENPKKMFASQCILWRHANAILSHGTLYTHLWCNRLSDLVALIFYVDSSHCVISHKKCIMILHFFTGKPLYLRTQISKDSGPLSIFLPFSSCSPTIDCLNTQVLWPILGHPWWTVLTIWHDSTWNVFIFGPNHRDWTCSTSVSERVLID